MYVFCNPYIIKYIFDFYVAYRLMFKIKNTPVSFKFPSFVFSAQCFYDVPRHILFYFWLNLIAFFQY